MKAVSNSNDSNNKILSTLNFTYRCFARHSNAEISTSIAIFMGTLENEIYLCMAAATAHLKILKDSKKESSLCSIRNRTSHFVSKIVAMPFKSVDNRLREL